MKSFEFCRDEKVIHLERTEFTVTSDSYQKAAEIAAQTVQDGLDETENVSIDICFFPSTNGQQLTIEQNEGAPTVKVFHIEHGLVASNATANQTA